MIQIPAIRSHKPAGVGGVIAEATLILMLSSGANAVAPPRTAAWCNSVGLNCPNGRPYAESICDTNPDIILCEDFNYPDAFFCNLTPTGGAQNQDHAWWNPARVGGLGSTVSGNGPKDDYIYDCASRLIKPAAGYPMKPSSYMPSGSQPDSVWVANQYPAQGPIGTATTIMLFRDPSINGGNYANGLPPTKDYYVRWQIYFTADWVWPGDPKTDPYNFTSGGVVGCVDNKIVHTFEDNFAWDGTTSNPGPTGAAYDNAVFTNCGVYDNVTPGAARFADSPNMRIGQAFEHVPLCSVCSPTPFHQEYAPYQHPDIMRNPHDSLIFGKVWRFDTGTWYTLEAHFKLGSGVNTLDGVAEFWVNGVKLYSFTDVPTCGSGNSNCNGPGVIWLSDYHNSADNTPWNGQQVIDNLVVSRAYIGPPQTGIANNVPPARPVNLTLK